MIIDEGFLSNAKKISETQPQQSEVKVPVIKRENWEYHIEITYKDIGSVVSIEKYNKYILSCDIFKEKGNIDFDDSDEAILTFDADMFISVDTVYQFLYYLNSYAGILDITGKKEIHIDTFSYDHNIYKMNIIYIDDRDLDCTYLDFGEFGIGRNALTRWMIRNSIINLLDTTSSYDMYNILYLYPVRINYNSIIKLVKNPKEEYTNIDYVYKISKSIIIKLEQIEKSQHEEFVESLKDYSQCEYIIYQKNEKIYIQTAYPVIFEGDYVYSLFILYSECNGFKNLQNMMDDNINDAVKILKETIENSDIDFIDYEKYEK